MSRRTVLSALGLLAALTTLPFALPTASACGGMTQIDPPSLQLEPGPAVLPPPQPALPPHDYVLRVGPFYTVASPAGENCGCGLRLPAGTIQGLAGVLMAYHPSGQALGNFGQMAESPATSAQLNNPGASPPVPIPQAPGQVWTGAHVQLVGPLPADTAVDLVFLLQSNLPIEDVRDALLEGHAIALGALATDLTFQDPGHFSAGEDFDVIGPASAAVSFYGYEVLPMGDAHLQTLPGTDGAELLVVSNIGSSGQDGIVIDPRGGRAMRLGYLPVGLGNLIGASMEFEVEYDLVASPAKIPFLPIFAHHILSSLDGGTQIDTHVRSQFEVSFNEVRVYNDGETVQQATQPLGAQAFAMGNTVAFESSPDIELTLHEAAHVMQQSSNIDLASGGPKAAVLGDRIGFTPVSNEGRNAVAEVRVRFANTGDVTFHTLDVEQRTPAPPAIGSVFMRPPVPNPSSGMTRFAYRLPTAGSVDLAIYDVAGRRLRSVVRGNQQAGDHIATWNGTDVQGQGVAAGVYYSRLRFGSEVHTAKLVVR